MRSVPLVLAILAVGGCARQESAAAREEQEMRRDVQVSQAMRDQGLSLGFGKYNPLGPDEPQMTTRGFTCYVDSEQALLRTLVARALRADGSEIARNEQKLVFEGGYGRPVRFTFAEMDPAQVARYQVDVAPY
jgi:hypothetical protein